MPVPPAPHSGAAIARPCGSGLQTAIAPTRGSGLQTAILISATLAAATLTLAPGAAAQTAGDFRYTYLEGGYQSIDLDGFNADGDGLFLGGSAQVAESVFVTADYDWGDFDRGIEASSLELGVGVIFPTAPDLDFQLRGGYVDAEVETRFRDVNDDGFFAAGGARWKVNETVELNGELKYLDLDLDRAGDDVVVAVGGVIDVRPRLAVLGGVEFADDTDTLRIGFRYYFDRP